MAHEICVWYSADIYLGKEANDHSCNPRCNGTAELARLIGCPNHPEISRGIARETRANIDKIKSRIKKDE